MLAEYGKLSLADVLAPAIQMAEGYPIERQLADGLEREKARIKEWPYSRALFLTHPGQDREAPAAGEIFRQLDLLATLRKLVEAERRALASGKSRKDAILAAYDRFYRGDIAQEFVRGSREQGGRSRSRTSPLESEIEEPFHTRSGNRRLQLDVWTPGPAMLQALNLLEPLDLRAMGFNSARYIHTLYQAMNLAFADRDFYYGDPDFPPAEPRRGLLSKEYAKARAGQIDWKRNDPNVKPGDPYPFQGEKNPYLGLLEKWQNAAPPAKPSGRRTRCSLRALEDGFFEERLVRAADAEGSSRCPSGGWNPLDAVKTESA